VKAYLLYRDRDFDWEAGLPSGHEDLIQDLELGTLLQAMAVGDKLMYDVSAKVLLTCLDDPEAIRYRQEVLTAWPAPRSSASCTRSRSAPCRTEGSCGVGTAAVTRTRHPTCTARPATWKPTWPG